MKTKLLGLLALLFLVSSSALAQSSFSTYEKGWQLDFAVGGNFDLIKSSSNPASALIASRSDVAPMFAININHLFSKKFGWYGNIQLSLYEEDDVLKTDEYGTTAKDVFKMAFKDGGSLHPSIDAGFLYRFESNRFRLYPSVGFGFNYHLSDQKATHTINGEGFLYKQSPSFLYVNFGLTANYYVTERGFIVLRAGFKQPIQKTSGKLMPIGGMGYPMTILHETTTAGRNLNVSIGYGFTFGK